MALQIECIDTGPMEVDSGEFVQYRALGTRIAVPVFSYLVHGAGVDPILIDTGMAPAAGRPGEDRLDAALHRHGLALKDIRYVFQTHLHSDHAGRTAALADGTIMVVCRRELEFACSGMMPRSYDLPQLLAMLDRVHAPGRMWFLDLPDLDAVEVLPGIAVQRSGGHTEGSINILIETADGRACVCGDVIQDFGAQVVAPPMAVHHREPRLPGNTAMSAAAERTAIKRTLASASWILSGHDRPLRVRQGLPIGFLDGLALPGPVKPIETV